MRFLIVFFILSFFNIAQAKTKTLPGYLQVYLFKGNSLPQKSKIYFKKNLESKPIKKEVFLGFLEEEVLEKEVYVSVNKKGPFHKVKIVAGERSQISFDLSKLKKLLSKHDSFQETLEISIESTEELKGSISSKETSSPIVGATVFLNGSSIQAKTNEQGEFKIRVPKSKEFSLSVFHNNYRAKSYDNLSYKSLKTNNKLELLPAMGEMSEVVVLAPKTKGSIEDLLKQRRNASSVSVFIGSEQFAKNGDSNAASALKRVSGLSLVEGKFVYVRGLGERYSSTVLNGTILPSPNPSRRVVPLDLFPTSLIESISIQKSYSADKPAQFSAGLVEIKTKSIPNKKSYFKLSTSFGASSDDILGGKESGFSYKGGGSSDLLGFDDGTRALPKEIREIRKNGVPIKYKDPDDWFGDGTGFTSEELSALGNSFSNIYNTTEEKIGPNFGISAEGGRSYKFGANKTGFVLKGLYSNNSDFDQQINRGYVVTSDANDLSLEREDNVLETSFRYNTGGVFSTGVELLKRHKLEFNSVITRSTENKTEIVLRDAIANEEDSFRITRLDWEVRELFNLQFKGEHYLYENFKGPKLSWFWSQSESSRLRPDSREYRYSLDTNEFIDRANGNARIFSDLNDIAKDFSAKISSKVQLFSWLELNPNFGVRILDKERESSTQRFTFFRQDTAGDVSLFDDLEEIISPENIASGAFQLRDSTLATDNYRAFEENNAAFLSLETKFLISKDSAFHIYSGARYEDHEQQVGAFNIVDGRDSTDQSRIDQNEVFTNFGAKYQINKKAGLRFGFSETVARPDLQEFAPIIYFNDEENVLEQGNPDLEIAQVKNIDLRYDYYFTPKEFVSLGVFRKDITKPIETVTVIGTEDIRTFKNTDSALNDGIEFEFRKRLFSNFYISGNFSLIDSKVNIGAENAAASTSLSRPLQGQSPYLINNSLEYSNRKWGLDSAISYNVAGRRISEVGAFGSPDIYEEPFEQLDFTLVKKLNKKVSIGFRAQNLLNPDAERTQGGFSVRSFQRGRSYSISLSGSI